MPGRQEFGVLDIKAEPLNIAAPVTQMGSTNPGQRSLGWSQMGEPQGLY